MQGKPITEGNIRRAEVVVRAKPLGAGKSDAVNKLQVGTHSYLGADTNSVSF